MAAQHPQPLGRLRPLLLTLFVGSSACELIYQVVWQRTLSLVFGNTTFATSVILACFMGGMALGAFYLGRLADRHHEPLRLYAYLEIGIAASAILFPFSVRGVTALYVDVHRSLRDLPFLSGPLRLVACSLLVLLPAFLMGGTLPVMSRLVVQERRRLSLWLGTLYGSGTLGGVVGSFCAGFLFVALFGARRTMYGAAALTLLVAGVALLMSRLRVGGGLPQGPVPQAAGEEQKGLQACSGRIGRAILAVYALSGFTALAYEVLWTRALLFYFGDSTYAFTTMLTTFLLGLALGSIAIARFVDSAKALMGLLALVEVLIGFAALASILVLAELPRLTQYCAAIFGLSWYGYAATRYIGAFAVMFVPTLLTGMAFPVVCRMYADVRRLGRDVGRVYSVNAVGCVVGALAAGFVMIPLLGVGGGIVFVALLNVVLGVILLLANPLRRGKVGRALVAAVTVIAVAILAARTPAVVFQPLKAGEQLLYYEEGTSATVAVVETARGATVLRINGADQVPTDYVSMRTFHVLGHLPSLLHRNPRKGLVLCFGAGITAGAMATHPYQQIDAVEISPEVVRAGAYFREENHSVLQDPRVNLVVSDARSYLLSTEERYDVISADASHPLSSDSWMLYTEEFYELCRQRLAPNGILCQWLPLHLLCPTEYRRIVRTFQAVFPNATLWFTEKHTILLGTRERLEIDYDLLARRLGREAVQADLRDLDLADPCNFLSTFMLGPEAMAAFTGAMPKNTDDQPFVQFAEAGHLMDTVRANLVELSAFRESVFPLLTNMGDEVRTVETALRRCSEVKEREIQVRMRGG